MVKNTDTILLGAHMSISGGLEKAIERGLDIGCTCIQLFTKSNRQWKSKELSEEQIESFREALKNSKMPVIAHAAYLLNLASPDKPTAARSTEALVDELKRCEDLSIPYLVLHPGSSLGTDQDRAISRAAKNIDKALDTSPGKVKILLENMAGQGSEICSTIEQIAKLRSEIKNKARVGMCLDTCHAHSAGYSFGTKEEYENFIKKIDQTVGLKHLKAIHTNDSKKGLGSRVDRHEHIGQGKIGKEAFGFIMNDSRLAKTPKILETPKGPDNKEDVINMKVLRNLGSK